MRALLLLRLRLALHTFLDVAPPTATVVAESTEPPLPLRANRDDALHTALGRQQMAVIQAMRQSGLALTIKHDIQQGGAVH